MPYEIDGVVFFTRSDFRRLRPGRGPARATPIKITRPDGSGGKLPRRTFGGRYLYTLSRPLPLPPAAPRPLRRLQRSEVG